jgi:hypothetical protein
MLSLRLANGFMPPTSVSSLAAANNAVRPISLRHLLTQLGSRTKIIRVAFVRYVWQIRNPPSPASPLNLPLWSDQTVTEIFAAANGWSVHDYWSRVTLGLLELQITFFPWRTLPGNQSQLDTTRQSVDPLVRQQAVADGVPLDQFDRMIALIHPPPGDRGNVSGDLDVILDEIGPQSKNPPFWLEFFEHETGHLLGFDHAYGPSVNPQAYKDDFCVMGYTGNGVAGNPTNHPIVPQPILAEVQNTIVGPGNIWFSGRRLAAANLYRTKDVGSVFAETSSVVRIGRESVQQVRLVALSEALLGNPVLAVATTAAGEVTVEYRLNTGDDAGLSAAPCLVLHSIGRTTVANPPPDGTVNPIVFEGSCNATVGSIVATTGGDVSALVMAVDPDGRSVSVQIQVL